MTATPGTPAMLQSLLAFPALFGLYLLLAGTVSTTEAGAGAACAGLGVLWLRRAGAAGEGGFRLRARMLADLGGALAAVPGQALQVLAALAGTLRGGRPAGRTFARPADGFTRLSLADDGPEARAERAVRVFSASLAPGCYVLRLDRRADRVVLHAFGSDDSRPDGLGSGRGAAP